MAKGPSPYKGHPKSEWPEIKAKLDAQRSAATSVTEPSAPEQATEGPQVIPPNLFSGENMTLEVIGLDGSTTDPLPGFKLRWFNGIDLRVEKAKRSGYAHVNRDEVLLNDELSDGSDVSDHVRKPAGTIGDKPYYAYLMKIPVWIKEAHDLEYRKVNDRTEDMVRRGQVSKNPQEVKQYVNDGRGPSNLPQNVADTKLYTSR